MQVNGGKGVRVGISTASLFTRLYTEDAIPLFAEWGVPEAEVFLTSFSEYDENFARKIAGSKGGLNVFSIHTLNTQYEPQLYSDQPRVKSDAYYWLKRVMESARALGAKRYTFHGVARMKRTFREDFRRTGLLTREIFDFCKRYGVTLCFENVEWSFYNRPGVFAELKKYCPDLMATLDIKQARISGYPYGEYLNEMGGALSHVHVSDAKADGKMCLPGEGVFDFDELFSRLRDTGFCGAVLIENYGKDYADLGALKASYEFLAEKAEKYS